MTGRPSLYTPELAAEICRRLAEGESLRAICRGEGMPPAPTVLGWRDAEPAFAEQYAHARDLQADAIAEDALDEATKATDPGLGRLAFDARKWFASKVAPKRYGDKIQAEHSGPDGAPVAFTWLPPQS